MARPVPAFDVYQSLARRPKSTARALDNAFGTLALTAAAMPAVLTTAAVGKATDLAHRAKYRFQLEAHKYMGEKITSPPVEDGAKTVPFFVQVNKKHYCFRCPETTTIGQVKALAFFKQGQETMNSLPAKSREWFGRFALQRHTGAHLSDERTPRS